MSLLRTVVSAAAVLGLSWITAASPAPELPHALPANTAVVLHLRDLPTLRANCEHTPFARTWAEPEVQKFFAPALAQFEREEVGQLFAEMKRTTGMEMKDLLDLLPGEVAIGVLDLDPYFQDGEDANPQVFILAQVGDNAAKIEELQRKGIEAKGEVETEEEFQGEKIHLVSKKDAETGELKPAEAWAIVNNLYIEAEPKEALQRIIAQFKGGGDSLAGVEDFAAMYQRQPDTNLALFINAEAIVPRAVAAANARGEEGQGGSNPLGLNPADLVRHLGLDALRSVTFTAAVTRESTTNEFRVGWREQRGIWRWLALGPPPVELPAQIPEAWLAAAAGRFSVPDMYRSIMESLRAAAPAIEGMARQQIQTLNGNLKFDLERDLLGSMGDEVFSGQTVNAGPDGKPVGARPTNRLIGFSLRDAATFNRTLETLKEVAPGVQQMIKTREYLGETIHTFEPPLPPPELLKPGQSGPPTLAYAVTRTHFLLAVGDVGMLENVLQTAAGNGRSYWQKPEVAEALAQLPSGASAVSAYDTGSVVNMMFSLLAAMQQVVPHGSTAEGEANGEAAEAGPESKGFVDPTAQPDPEVIARHWKTSASGTYMESGGIRFFGQLKHSE